MTFKAGVVSTISLSLVSLECGVAFPKLCEVISPHLILICMHVRHVSIDSHDTCNKTVYGSLDSETGGDGVGWETETGGEQGRQGRWHMKRSVEGNGIGDRAGEMHRMYMEG